MTDVATLAAAAVAAAANQSAPRAESQLTTRKVFVVLHGAYGNLFLSKFATGEVDSNGKDKGIRAAMLVWDASLSKFPATVVETALARLQRDNPDFPPNLPQLVKVCEACAPRQTHGELEGWKRLPAPEEKPVHVDLVLVGDGRDWARRIVARADVGDRTIKRGVLVAAKAALQREGRTA